MLGQKLEELRADIAHKYAICCDLDEQLRVAEQELKDAKQAYEDAGGKE